MSLVWFPSARRELREAIRFYNRKQAGLGQELKDQVTTACGRLLENPWLGRSSKSSRRRYVVERFPYAIVYERVVDVIRIVGLVHRNRGPDYLRRVQGRVRDAPTTYAHHEYSLRRHRSDRIAAAASAGNPGRRFRAKGVDRPALM